jgi:hypothetical protein
MNQVPDRKKLRWDYHSLSRRAKILRSLGVGSIVLAVTFLIALNYYGWRETQRFSGYEEVVSLVKEGKLKADAKGDIRLPKPWAELVTGGHIYQTYDKQSGLVILFPTAVDNYLVDWGGGKTEKARDIAGYVYCSGPLPSDGWFSFTGMSDVSTWNQNSEVRLHWYYAEPFCSR